MPADPLSLEFLWKFLEPILGDVIKERIKPKGSVKKASDRVLNLYEKLGDVDKKTDDFVTAFNEYVAVRTQLIPSPKKLVEKQNKLRIAAITLMGVLPQLARALDNVNPQLEIHNQELVKKIEHYMMVRNRILTDLEESVDSIQKDSKQILKRQRGCQVHCVNGK